MEDTQKRLRRKNSMKSKKKKKAWHMVCSRAAWVAFGFSFCLCLESSDRVAFSCVERERMCMY